MEGVYMTLSSDLTLNGTPKDAGTYKISVSITDMQGRTAVSNTLPFRIYTGEETLADRLKVENFRQYESGLYAWDIMEPWAIKNFGSNVDGEENSVRVPAALEAWFGSHESGTYGYLGYDLAWKEVKKGNIPQTLYIPAGCSLTLTNMEILSSVRIVVENGGKLTLSDSVVQGMIEVQSGGTFSMNYDSFNQKFTTGSSICGQLRMEDGSVLENAAIYSHINYLANGDLTDRSSAEPVVTTTGNVTVKGQMMAFLTVEDLFGTVEVVVFPRDYEKYRQYLEEDNKIFVKGRVSEEDDKASKLICEKILPFGQKKKELWIQFPDKETYLEEEAITYGYLADSEGNDEVMIYCEKEKIVKKLPANKNISINPQILSRLMNHFGENRVKVVEKAIENHF